MSLAGEHLLDTLENDDREAGIFSTISVPTSMSQFEPASTSVAKSGTLPFLDGILGDIAPDALASEVVGASGLAISSTRESIIGSSTISGGVIKVSPSTTILELVSSTMSSKAGPSTIFTTIPVSSTPNPVGPAATSAPVPVNMANNANIMLPSNKLFPLGVVIVILTGSTIVILWILLIRKCTKRRRQRRLGDRILSNSSDIGNAPYPFDAKAYDDDIESRYPTMPKSTYLESPPTLAPVVGIASSFPSQFETEVEGRFDNTIRGEYTQTIRAGPIHDRPDTFTCAMYPAGSCPIEHEISTNTPILVQRGSPVPSFNTGRMDEQPIITSHQHHGRSSSSSGKLLTPPQPLQQRRHKSKHIPAPLMISPSINEGTNSVRGFTPRKSTISVGSAYTGI